MKKSDVIARIASEANLPKRVAAIVFESVIAGITEALQKGERVTIVGFGTFSVKKSADGSPGKATGHYKDFGSAPPDDPNELQKFARRVRRGQAPLRRKLLRLYGSKCAITGTRTRECARGCAPRSTLEKRSQPP